MDSLLVEVILRLGPIFLLLAVGFASGSWLEARHFSSIRERERMLRSFPAVTFEEVPPDWRVAGSGLVAGSAVVSLDYFKRFLASLRVLFGGRIRAFEPLLDRGRREAVLRMKEAALNAGYDAVINVRLETSRIANADGGGTAGVEMLAYGTALRLERRLGAGDAV